MPGPRFKSGVGRRRQIKGSIGGGGPKGNLSRKMPTPAPATGGGGGGGGGTPKPDFRTNPLIPWDNSKGQLFNQGLVKLPSLNPVTGLGDPRLVGVAGDSLRERRDTYNRIAAAKRPSTALNDPRLTKVAGDSLRERQQTYNRIVSGNSPLQAGIQAVRRRQSFTNASLSGASGSAYAAAAKASTATKTATTTTKSTATATKATAAAPKKVVAPVKKKVATAVKSTGKIAL